MQGKAHGLKMSAVRIVVPQEIVENNRISTWDRLLYGLACEMQTFDSPETIFGRVGLCSRQRLLLSYGQPLQGHESSFC